MNPCTFSSVPPYTVAYLKTLPAPTLKRLLRQAGESQRSVARYHGCSHVTVNKTIRRQITSQPVWLALAAVLNKKRPIAASVLVP